MKRLEAGRMIANRIVPTLRNKMCDSGIDYSNALHALAVITAGGNECLTGGRSRGGHSGSLKRVGKRFQESLHCDDFLIEKTGEMNYFGGGGIGIRSHNVLSRTLMMQERDVIQLGEQYYLESPYCRPDEYAELLKVQSGLFMLNQMGMKLDGTSGCDGRIFKATGSAYVKDLLRNFDADPDLCWSKFMSDCERTEITSLL